MALVVGFITKGLSSSSLIKVSSCRVEIDDDDDGKDKLFDSIGLPKLPSEEVDWGEFSSPLSCVTENKKKKIVNLRIHLDGDKKPRYNQQP